MFVKSYLSRHDVARGRSEFLLRAEPERSEGGLSEEIKTARARHRATQHQNSMFYLKKNIYFVK